MIAQVYAFPTSAIQPPLWSTVDPAEHAARQIHEAVNTFVLQINDAERASEIQRLLKLLQPCAVEVLSLQDVAAHKEHALQGGH